MDLVTAIGLLSSLVTLEEAGRSWVLIVKDKVNRKKIDINNWDSRKECIGVMDGCGWQISWNITFRWY